jgi:hypothetical protein
MGLSVFLDQKNSLGKVCFQHFPNSMFVMLIQHVVDEKKAQIRISRFAVMRCLGRCQLQDYLLSNAVCSPQNMFYH